jgi:hypothetical protein
MELWRPESELLITVMEKNWAAILRAGLGIFYNGGLNPRYQIGGSRSIQFALKLQF